MGLYSCYLSVPSVMAIACSVLALLLNVIAIGTTHWVRSIGEGGQPEYDIGLMRHCDLTDGNHCGDMDELHALLDDRDIGMYRPNTIIVNNIFW